jgi:hypothetical protein
VRICLSRKARVVTVMRVKQDLVLILVALLSPVDGRNGLWVIKVLGSYA